MPRGGGMMRLEPLWDVEIRDVGDQGAITLSMSLRKLLAVGVTVITC